MAWENVERQERIREEGEFQDKEKFITESYARQLELNKKEAMIVQVEEKLNQSKTLDAGGLKGFYNKLLDRKEPVEGDDIREQAKMKVEAKTNIDQELNVNEAKREVGRKEKEDK